MKYNYFIQQFATRCRLLRDVSTRMNNGLKLRGHITKRRYYGEKYGLMELYLELNGSMKTNIRRSIPTFHQKHLMTYLEGEGVKKAR